jgi:hypothetical protein
MRTKLNNDQILKLDAYRDSYIEIGLNTDEFDTRECAYDIQRFYTDILKREITQVIVLDSPYHCWTDICRLFEINNDHVRWYILRQICFHTQRQIFYQVGRDIRTNIRNQVNKQVRSLIWNQVRKRVLDIVGYGVGVQIWDKVSEQVLTQNYLEYVNPYLQGSFDSYIFSFYDYFINVVGVEIDNATLANYNTWKSTLKYGQIFPLEGVCYVSKKPEEINVNSAGKLHAEDKPAVSYEDLKLYYINGRQYNVSDNNKIGEVQSW